MVKKLQFGRSRAMISGAYVHNLVLVRFADGKGEGVRLACQIGQKWFTLPEVKLHPMSRWLAAQLDERLATTAVPSIDVEGDAVGVSTEAPAVFDVSATSEDADGVDTAVVVEG